MLGLGGWNEQEENECGMDGAGPNENDKRTTTTLLGIKKRAALRPDQPVNAISSFEQTANTPAFGIVSLCRQSAFLHIFFMASV